MCADQLDWKRDKGSEGPQQRKPAEVCNNLIWVANFVVNNVVSGLLGQSEKVPKSRFATCASRNAISTLNWCFWHKVSGPSTQPSECVALKEHIKARLPACANSFSSLSRSDEPRVIDQPATVSVTPNKFGRCSAEWLLSGSPCLPDMLGWMKGEMREKIAASGGGGAGGADAVEMLGMTAAA